MKSPAISAARLVKVMLTLGCGVALTGFAGPSGLRPSQGTKSTSSPTSEPVDPGVRSGKTDAGTPYADLSAGELSFFTDFSVPTFNEVEAFSKGLGPRFNSNSCASCHVYPAVGGASPVLNPLVQQVSTMAPGNTLPPFLTLNGPIREARFIKASDGTLDGSVHNLFTIAGRTDSPKGCAITQPDFSNTANIRFRIPTPLFGMGLIEAIPDSTLRANLAADPTGQKAANKIGGHFNTSPNDGEIAKFGWKAQNVSLLLFSGEAYNVEMGVTNDLFPNEREEDPNCATNPTPESDFGFAVGSATPSDIESFRSFMRFLAPLAPACEDSACSTAIQSGHALAASIGCFGCHTETLTTGLSSTAALSEKPVHLFSDLAVHRMGQTLQDGITQGLAGPDEFRTAPLWGLGQRVFMLHDGRTSDLLQAILAHHSPYSEANQVIDNFNLLSDADQQNILLFLRSL